MKRSYKILGFVLQILAWGFNFVLPYINKPPGLHKYLFPFHITHITEQSLYLTFFYANFFWFIPKYYHQKHIAKYISSLLISVVLILLVNNLLSFALFGSDKNFDSVKITYFFPLVIVYALSTGLRVLYDWFDLKQNTAVLKKEKQIAEMAYLRSQINPHFLFNTLNNINALIHIDADKAEQTVIKLSKIMRALLVNETKQKIELENEIDILNSYIDLQRIRLNEDTTLNYSVKGIPNNLFIEPFILINFVENTFKHGIGEGKNEVYIEINIINDELSLVTKNPITKGNKDSSSGIGLKNVKKRLDIIYKNSYDLLINDSNGIFYVELKLKLT